MLTVLMTSMPASSSASTSCQRFVVRSGSGDVRVRELVHERDGRAPPQHRVEIHLLELCAAVLDRVCAATTGKSPMRSAVRGRPCVSTKPIDHVAAALGPAPSLVEHGEGLAHAGRSTEIDPQHTAHSRRSRPAARRGERANRP